MRPCWPSQFAMILLITPAMTAGSIAGERERQTLDMLLVTNTGSLRIVAGKLLESLGYVALLLVAALPTMCLTLITGGVTLADVLTGALFLLVTAFAALSVGVFASRRFPPHGNGHGDGLSACVPDRRGHPAADGSWRILYRQSL